MLLLLFVVVEVDGTVRTCACRCQVPVNSVVVQHLLTHQYAVLIGLMAEAIRGIDVKADP